MAKTSAVFIIAQRFINTQLSLEICRVTLSRTVVSMLCGLLISNYSALFIVTFTSIFTWIHFWILKMRISADRSNLHNILTIRKDLPAVIHCTQ